MNSIRNSRYRFYCMALVLFPVISYSQTTDSLKPKKDTSKIRVTGILISGGVNYTQYNSGSFPNYLFTLTDTKPVSIPNQQLSSGSPTPSEFSYNKSSFGPGFSIGLEFNKLKFKDIYLNHIIEISGMRISGQLSGSDNYQETQSGAPPADSYINDTVQATYVQTVLSIGYKFQPTYKCMFLSFGINGSINFIKGSLQIKEQNHKDYYDEITNKYIDTTLISARTNTANALFVNFPLQFGVGAHINTKRIFLEPAFYFMPCFMKGYNMYNASIRIVYKVY